MFKNLYFQISPEINWVYLGSIVILQLFIVLTSASQSKFIIHSTHLDTVNAIILKLQLIYSSENLKIAIVHLCKE